MAARYRLKLNRLDFISPVDVPAQETARVLLIKRSGPAEGFARVAKVDDGLGLVFCWAFTSKVAGADYHDLQGDAIDEDFIKAAADFMAGGGAIDEMHDGQVSAGRVVFAFPMTPEIAKTYGVTTTTTGLMVALKPPADVLAKFKSGEYTGVSIAGLGTRELVGKGGKAAPTITITNHVDGQAFLAALESPAGQRAIADIIGKAKPPRIKSKPKKPPANNGMAMPYKRIGKMAALTSVTDGHQHTLDLDAPADSWSATLMTSYQTMEGAAEEHCHAWVYDATTGAITIALDSGHDHTASAVVPPDVLAEAAADEEDPEAMSMTGEDEPSGGTTIVIAARAPGGVSTPEAGAPTVTAQEQAMATEQETKIAELTKTVERLNALASLNDAQRAYHAGLSGAESVAFLAKSATERTAIVEPIEVAKRAAAEVVYTSKSGEVFRKSDDPRLVAMAKRADVAELATEQVAFEKRASDDLSHFAKAVGIRAAIVKAIDGIADETVRKESHEAIKGANAALKSLGTPIGIGDDGGPVAVDPLTAWNTGLEAFAKSKNVANPLDATPAFLATEQGRALKKSYDATRGYAQHA